MDEFDDLFWVRSWLSSGERVLWRGRPEHYPLFERRDLLLIPFSILWGGFAVFWEAEVILSEAPLLFPLWGIPFVCIGLYMMIGRFFHRSWLLRHSDYVITDRRILRRVGKKVDMLLASSLPPMQVERKEDGSGTIRFQGQEMFRSRSLRSFAEPEGFALTGLADVQRALDAIQAMAS